MTRANARSTDMGANKLAQYGFTLIEMVAVIIILAIMAATALPKFVNLSQEARLSAVQGMAGGLRSAAALAKSQWLATNSSLSLTVSMGVAAVSVWNAATATPSGIEGYPTPTTNGIVLALDNSAGFTSSADSGGHGQRYSFWPTGVANSTICSAIYESGSVIVTATAAVDCI